VKFEGVNQFNAIQRRFGPSQCVDLEDRLDIVLPYLVVLLVPGTTTNSKFSSYSNISSRLFDVNML
jgi:hypothetical protein